VYNTILSSLSSGCVYRKVPYGTLIQACYDKRPVPGNGMGLNPCVPRGTAGFYTELYKNHLSGECRPILSVSPNSTTSICCAADWQD